MSGRKMSAKGFLHKASGKISAAAFLKQHREWLTTGELAEFTSPILAKLDKGEIMPTPAFSEIKTVVLSHHLAEETRKAEDAMTRADAPKVQKNYIVTIYNSKGDVQTRINPKGEEENLRQSFDNGSQAEGWADRRLFEGEPDWFATIEHTKIPELTRTVLRADAIARILREKRGPVMKSKPQGTSKLSFGMKCKGDHFHFSKG